MPVTAHNSGFHSMNPGKLIVGIPVGNGVGSGVGIGVGSGVGAADGE